MDAANSRRARTGLLFAALALFFVFIVFQLYRHPDTASLLMALPSPAAFACNLRCLGAGPTLQVLGETGQALLMIFMSLSFLYAILRTVQRILRTMAFIDRVEEKAVPVTDAPRFPFLDKVTVFEDRLPLAFTGGFLKPRVFISTKLLDILNETELRAVILHEFHHQRSKDPLRGLLVSFISDFLFFLPVSRILKKTHSLTAEMAADAHSVRHQSDPADLAGSLLKVQKSSGPAASWFFDPTTERAKHLLGERSGIRLPLARVLLTVVVLAVSALIALVPVKRSLSAIFISHDQTCTLRSGHQ
jgi:Zn-dependent protease with chaperone function